MIIRNSLYSNGGSENARGDGEATQKSATPGGYHNFKTRERKWYCSIRGHLGRIEA